MSNLCFPWPWPLSLSCYPQASQDPGCCWNAVNGSTRPGKPHPAFLSPIHRLASYPFCWGWVWPWLLLWGFGPTNQCCLQGKKSAGLSSVLKELNLFVMDFLFDLLPQPPSLPPWKCYFYHSLCLKGQRSSETVFTVCKCITRTRLDLVYAFLLHLLFNFFGETMGFWWRHCFWWKPRFWWTCNFWWKHEFGW